MFAMRTLEVAQTPAKDTPYNNETLLKSEEYKRGQEILNNTDFSKYLANDGFKTAGECKRMLSSPVGCYMLGHNPPLITIEQVAKFHTALYLKAVVSVDGISMLKHNPPLMTIDHMLSVPILFSLQALVSKYGAIALAEDLITIDQAKKINYFNLQSILTHNGLIALREGLITVDQLMNHDKWGSSMHVFYLVTPEGITCLRNRSMTYDKAQDMTDSALKTKLEKLCSTADQKVLETSTENVSASMRIR